MDAQDKAMGVYERIVNAESTTPEQLPELAAELIACDDSGQYLCSSARYLGALNAEGYAPLINRLVASAIERDREHKYISQLLPALWGDDFMEKATSLRLSDDNFRRIFKRIYPGR